MKKQNMNSSLVFNKASIAELNQDELKRIQGGTNFNPFATNPLSCTYCVASSNGPGTITDFYETINKPL